MINGSRSACSSSSSVLGRVLAGRQATRLISLETSVRDLCLMLLGTGVKCGLRAGIISG